MAGTLAVSKPPHRTPEAVAGDRGLNQVEFSELSRDLNVGTDTVI